MGVRGGREEAIGRGSEIYLAIRSALSAVSRVLVDPLRSAQRCALLSSPSPWLSPRRPASSGGDDGVSSSPTSPRCRLHPRRRRPETALKSLRLVGGQECAHRPSDGVPKAPSSSRSRRSRRRGTRPTARCSRRARRRRRPAISTRGDEVLRGRGRGFSAEEPHRLYASLCKLDDGGGSRARASSARSSARAPTTTSPRSSTRRRPSRRRARPAAARRRGGGRRRELLDERTSCRPTPPRARGCAAERDAGADRRGGRDPQDGDGRPRRRRPLLPALSGQGARVPPRDDRARRPRHDARSPASTPARRRSNSVSLVENAYAPAPSL